ncbi:MAG TPA: transcriptional initiation protein Tat, partial [Chloroflexota bacterium]
MLITRRGFLTGAAIVAASSAFAPSFLARTAYTALAAGGNQLVVIQLGGGNDGINSVIPYASQQYAQSRPTLAVPQDQVLQLDANVGLHPNLKALKALFDQKALAVVQGVGYPNPNRSHFQSMQIWQTASPDNSQQTGWLGRYDEANLQGQRLGALNFGEQLPRTFWTEHTVVPSIGSLNNYQFLTDPKAPDDKQAQIDAINKIFNNPVGRDAPDFFRQSAIDAFQTATDLKAAVAGSKSAAQYPTTALGRQLQLVGQLIGSKLGARIYYVSMGGFDTHSGEKNTHDRLMQ